MFDGGCLCGEVRYRIDAALGAMTHCHCTMCRRAHGAAFATFVSAPSDRFHWTKGEDRIARYRSSENVDRVFCPVCGSSLQFLWLPNKQRVWIAAGTLDSDPGVRADAHIFVAYKAPWFEITDGIAQFPEDRAP